MNNSNSDQKSIKASNDDFINNEKAIIDTEIKIN